jgi:multimeric flavodoxin WrbA
MLESVLEGARVGGEGKVSIEVRPALSATASDVLDAAGYLLGTPANLGYMSGALKHFFDTIYYPCLDATSGRPHGFWMHGNNDTDGARLAIEKVVTGLGWKAISQPVAVVGKPSKEDLEQCWELGAVASASLNM